MKYKHIYTLVDQDTGFFLPEYVSFTKKGALQLRKENIAPQNRRGFPIKKFKLVEVK